MTYRSLLVHLDANPLCEQRSAIAIRLAQAMGCHLVGLAPTGLVELPSVLDAGGSVASFTAQVWAALLLQAEQAADRFRETCRAAGLKSFEAVQDRADAALSLVQHAHCSDLTVLTQADPAAANHRDAQALVEQVVLHSARPTLVVPYAGRFDTLGTQALVAWDDSREAARAVADALPMLRRAESVQVVAWREPGQDDDDSIRPRLDALNQWLMWQGVQAEIRIEATELGVADAMLSRAADLGSDLIVMGAYGHARWAERVLGGATRGLLASMTVPVLMSH